MSSFVAPILSNHLQTTNTSASVESLHFYSKSQIIPIYPESIWQVDQGIVQLTALSLDGEEGVVGWAGPGMCFGAWMHTWQTYQALG